MSIVPHLILSLDGGGIRGALSGRIIERLEDEIPFLHKVEHVAGTSIGGICALYLADERPPTEITGLFKKHGDLIFKSRGFWDKALGGADEVIRANYDNADLKGVLQSVFGDMTLDDLKKNVLVSSFDLDNEDGNDRRWKAKFFHNFGTPGSDGDEKVVDIALRTSAAPTYFPSHQGYVDGGMAANNPSMSAVAKSVKAGFDFDRVCVLSIGTGINPQYVAGERLDWGYKQWLPKLIPLIFDAMIGVPDYQCRELLNGRYHRINPTLPSVIDLADVDRVDDLIQIADSLDLTKTIEWLDNLLNPPKPPIRI